MADLTAIILAGGRSRRFGSNKALAKVNGRTMIEHIIAAAAPLADELLISGNPHDLAFLGLPVVPDLHADAGPAAGLYAALRRSSHDKNLVLACDMPLIDRPLLERLVAVETNKEAVITRQEGHLQFFPGIFFKKMLSRLESFLAPPASKNRPNYALSLRALLTEEVAEVIELDEAEPLINVNTRRDYERLLRRIGACRKG